MLHDTYLPFTDDQLRGHFAPIAGDEQSDPERHLAYYRGSIRRAVEHAESLAAGIASSARRGRQIEKDERFWVVAALMALHHGPDPQDAYAQLLDRAGLDAPGDWPDWRPALDGELHLFFEVGLNSPLAYRQHLQTRLAERSPVPYVREAGERAGLRLEGATQVDALLLAPATNVGVLFEAKVVSDCSTTVTYDVLRNQLARNIDVMLERQNTLPPPLSERDPDKSCFVLLTPELFRDQPRSRLYGWLLNEYRSRPDALGEDLPHRDCNWEDVAERIGWATFEDCQRIRPDACRWLRPPVH